MQNVLPPEAVLISMDTEEPTLIPLTGELCVLRSQLHPIAVGAGELATPPPESWPRPLLANTPQRRGELASHLLAHIMMMIQAVACITHGPHTEGLAPPLTGPQRRGKQWPGCGISSPATSLVAIGLYPLKASGVDASGERFSGGRRGWGSGAGWPVRI